MNTLYDTWDILYHINKEDWTQNGYKKIYSISTISEYWKFFNTFNYYNYNSIFMIKKDYPIWDNKNYINGGCWSFKIDNIQAFDLWNELTMYLVTNNLSPVIYNDIIGISINLKKNNNTIIKIWNINSKNNNINLINNNIVKKWGPEIIYIKNNI